MVRATARCGGGTGIGSGAFPVGCADPAAKGLTPMKSKPDLESLTIVSPRSALARRTLLRGMGTSLIAAPLWNVLGEARAS